MSANDPALVKSAFPPGPPFEKIVAAFTILNQKKFEPDSPINADRQIEDDPLDNAAYRKKILSSLCLDPDNFTAAKQVHEDSVCCVTEKERGRGADDNADAIPSTDALITDLPDVPIGVFTADCVPIFLYDPERLAIGVVHAGWRGTVVSIAQKTVQLMCDKFGSNARDMFATFGPSIGQCCYEVGADVYNPFAGKFDYVADLFKSTGEEKWHLDLWRANRRQLENAGLRADQIIEPRICTACNTRFYPSYRKMGPRAGRTLSVVAIKRPQ